MSVENKKILVWWSGPFNVLIKEWLTNNRLDLLDTFNNSILFERDLWLSCGVNAYRFPVVTGLQDRKHEDQLMYNISKSNSKWIPYEEQPTQSFTDCMFDAAKSVAAEGKTIDFFWSGGVDSNAMLIAFNELGLHKQLRVIMGGPTESPTLFDKLIKGRIDYVIDETSKLNNTYMLAKPDEHVFTAGPEADTMFGAKANIYGDGIHVNDYSEWCDLWNAKRRYWHTHRCYRMIVNCQLDWIDINNHKTFYAHPSIEKFAINHTLSGEMVFYDMTDETFGSWQTWARTLGYQDRPESAKGQEHYMSCKMPLRDFIYSFTKDRSVSYELPKVASEYRIRYVQPEDPSKHEHVERKSRTGRNIAVTGDGDVITRVNFSDYDWSEYINVS